MRHLTLSKSGTQKLRSHQLELKASDFEGAIRSCTPGEWFSVSHNQTESWIGYINPLVDEKYPCAYLVEKMATSQISHFRVQDFLVSKIRAAFEKRLRLSGYEKNSRVFYGMSDGLSGLIVDQFENGVVIQINTAGLDQFRELIKTTLEEISQRKVFFLDNQKYREREVLPVYEQEVCPDLEIIENNLHYFIRSQVFQKVGFYFDHRENRYQLAHFLKRFQIKPERGIDLFSYVGAWGITALQSGCQQMEFVDQGDFSKEIEKNLKLNSLEGRGKFIRQDVFKYLDQLISSSSLYHIILCDPPAFAKSPALKNQALEGYSKLHRKVFKIAAPSSIVAFSSCTHYVSQSEFQKNILDAALKENKKIQLIYCGMQGYDHPIATWDDKSNYIKSLFYMVEN